MKAVRPSLRGQDRIRRRMPKPPIVFKAILKPLDSGLWSLVCAVHHADLKEPQELVREVYTTKTSARKVALRFAEKMRVEAIHWR